MALKRLLEEYEKLTTSGGESWFSVAYDSVNGRTDKFTWVVTFKGPEHYSANPVPGEEGVRPSPYSKGMFTARLQFSKHYPTTPPKVSFITRVFHPNINNTGGICSDDIKKLWRAKSGVMTVIAMLRGILASPNPDDPLELEPGNLMKTDLEKFEKKVREMIDAQEEDDDDDDDSGWDDDDDV